MDDVQGVIDTEQAKTVLRMLLEEEPCIAWATDSNLRLTSLLGAPQTVSRLPRNLKVGRTISDAFQKAASDVTAVDAHRRALSGKAIHLDLILSGRIYCTYIRPIKDDNNQIVGCLGFAHDVTDAFRTKGELIAERNLLQNYLDVANVIFVVLSREGNILLLNQKGYDILGYEKDSLLGKNWFTTCLPTLFRDHVRDVHEKIMSGELELFEYYENPVQTRSGDQRVIEWHNTLLTDSMGQRTGSLSSGIDITERHQAEEALRKIHAEMEQRIVERTAQIAEVNRRLQNEVQERQRVEMKLRQGYEELENIYNSTVDGMLIADAGTKRFVRANASIISLLGYSEEELLSLSIPDIHPAGELPRIEEHFGGLARGHITTLSNCSVLRKDGTVFYADIAGNKIDYHQSLCCIGFFRDVTERKEAHETLQRNEQILRRLLDASDQERQLVAYEIHDGLAQQIASAKMYFDTFKDLIQTDVHDRLKTMVPEQAEKIFAEGVRLLGDSFIEVRRIIGELRPLVIDEEGVLVAIEHYVRNPRFHGVLQIDFHHCVNFDRLTPPLENALLRIVQEGLRNVQKHSQSQKVRVELVQEGTTLRMEIQDWGVGFDVQAPRETGFGLEGIRQRVRLLGGLLQIDSVPGCGTRILVQLPVEEREKKQEPR
ncbi:MAG: PAS domain S-box protein [Pirellulales bacterium]|nr:PAS domain S-box protein [Pirellulales bacterium]